MSQQGPQHIIITAPKNVGVAIALALFFGPLGLLYSSVAGGIVMFFVGLFVMLVTFGVGILIILPVCAIWAAVAANSYNSKLMASVNTAISQAE